VLEMAKEWGVAPWAIEADASTEWVARWALMRTESNKAAKRAGARGGKVSKGRKVLSG
jgi:hypothetical protein